MDIVVLADIHGNFEAFQTCINYIFQKALKCVVVLKKQGVFWKQLLVRKVSMNRVGEKVMSLLIEYYIWRILK